MAYFLLTSIVGIIAENSFSNKLLVSWTLPEESGSSYPCKALCRIKVLDSPSREPWFLMRNVTKKALFGGFSVLKGIIP